MRSGVNAALIRLGRAIVACSLFVSIACPGAVEDSVVRIIAGKQVGTGFVWEGAQNRKYVATALHTLAGSSRIFYDTVSPETELRVHKMDKESDLALLLPKSSKINKPALDLSDSNPAADKRYMIYGYPAGVKLVQGDSLEFSAGRQNVTMRELLPNNILREVTASGYPQETLKILRVSSGITPGHSGAPIVDQGNNTVIGIGAGGLSKRGFRRVNWAVPASSYLLNLERRGASGDTDALAPAAEAAFKFSAPAKDAPPSLSTRGKKYYKIYEVPLDELLTSLSTEADEDEPAILDAELIQEIMAEAREEGYTLSEVLIDVYQNTETGAMIFVPAGAELSSQGDVLRASSKDDRVVMYFQIVQSNSFREALRAKDRFMAFLDQELGADWALDPGSDHEPQHDRRQGLWDLWLSKYQPADADADADIEGDLVVTLEIDYSDEERYGDFLGVAVAGRGFSRYSEDDYALLHQMDVCALISGFVP